MQASKELVQVVLNILVADLLLHLLLGCLKAAWQRLTAAFLHL